MSAYRIELSTNARASCRATHHWKAEVKIGKGELRHGTWVPFKESGGYHWRHWGCVTPTVLYNWNEQCGGDMEMVDGFDELPEEAQDKVRTALENGHVDDEDWGGDIQLNRYQPGRSKGMFLSKSARRALGLPDPDDEEDADAGEPDEDYGKPKRKRASKNVKQEAGEENDEAEEVRPAKKARGKKAIKEESEEAAVPTDDIMDVEDTKPAKKARGKKAVKAEPTEDEAELEETKPAKRSRAKKAVKTEPDENAAEEHVKPAKKTRGKKATKAVEQGVDGAGPEDESDVDADTQNAKPARKARGRKATRNAGVEQDAEVDGVAIKNEAPTKKKRAARGKAAKSAATVKDDESDTAVKNEVAAEPVVKNEEGESAAIDEDLPAAGAKIDYDDEPGAPIKDEEPENDVADELPAEEPVKKTKGHLKGKGKGRSKKAAT